ncbi:hypothetical protein [Anabaena lutea]|uniref:Uncharacterized protein n=1 Tax=Anabaena lutea FACHB-196 TaxID=2692881 RepID=A0ABR8FMX8_9NOST|nr:hypothetical protein [Anabaena lutea]MBD2571353.1 hypothetical protein [Anabaena lutea FACHB-196]
MKNNINDFMEIALMQLPSIIWLTWKAASEKAAIYKEIDAVGDSLGKLVNSLDKRLDLHIQDSHAARESLTEKIQGQGKRFGAKLDRIEAKLDKCVE